MADRAGRQLWRPDALCCLLSTVYMQINTSLLKPIYLFWDLTLTSISTPYLSFKSISCLLQFSVLGLVILYTIFPARPATATWNRNFVMNFLVLATGFSSLMLLTGPAMAQTKNGLQVGFYNTKCPQAEMIVAKTVAKYFLDDNSVPAALLRMHFHDCFVRGCDASILIDSIEGSNVAEKEALPNLTVRGFEIIDEAKAQLEKACPGNVSCADIIALATRDAVYLAKGPYYNVPTGRRDGNISSIDDVDLPSPRAQVSEAAQEFKNKGLNLTDMVVLLGAHSVGVSHCAFFSDRLYNFQQTGKADPSMNSTFVELMKNICPPPTSFETGSIQEDPTVFLDQGTSFIIDNSFYKQLGWGLGILQIDQELALAKSTKGMVASFATHGAYFHSKFGMAMIKMGNIGVLTGTEGDIRSQCRVINPAN